MPPSNYHDDPLQAQLQAEAQAQLEAQLQAQAQGQGQGQHQGQGQWESSTNLNGNGNLNGNANGNWNANESDNHNSNCNTNANVNANYNVSSTDVSVHVDVSATVTPLIGDTSGQSFVLYMPQDIAQTISGNGNEIALDQINALTANNYADNNDVYQSANSSFNDNHVTAGEVHAGDAIQGALSSGAMTANATSSGAIDAFTQSIVLGSNLQNNTSPRRSPATTRARLSAASTMVGTAVTRNG
jgi:hypothetical protein